MTKKIYKQALVNDLRVCVSFFLISKHSIMVIERITVRNFKGFENNTFYLNPHFTVFIGNNATGKTTVLEALALAAGSFLRGIDVAKHESRGINKNEIRVATIQGQPRPQLPVEIHAFGKLNNKEIKNGWKRSIEKISQRKITF